MSRYPRMEFTAAQILAALEAEDGSLKETALRLKCSATHLQNEMRRLDPNLFVQAAQLRATAGLKGPRKALVEDTEAQAEQLAQEREWLVAALQAEDGDHERARERLKLPVRTFRRLLAKHDLRRRDLLQSDEQREKLVMAIAKGGFTVSGAAEAMGVSRPTIDRWMKQLGIPIDLLRSTPRRPKQ